MTAEAGTSRASRSVGGPVAVLVAATLWGTTGTATHFAPGVPAFVFGAVTFGLGGLVLAATTGRGAVRAVVRPGVRAWVVLGAVSLVVYAVAFYAALADAGVALGTTVAIGSSPVFAGLVEWVADARRVTGRWVAATLVSVAGMGIVALARPEGAGGGAVLLGLGSALLAGLTYATYSWAVARGMRAGAGATVGLLPSALPLPLPPGPALPPLPLAPVPVSVSPARRSGGPGVPVSGRGVVGAVFGLAALPLVVVAVVAGQDAVTVGSNWPVFVWLALVPTVVGHSLYALGLRSVSASAATLLSLFEPVVAAVLAVLVVGEDLGVTGWVGIALVVAGLALLAVPGRRTGAGPTSR